MIRSPTISLCAGLLAVLSLPILAAAPVAASDFPVADKVLVEKGKRKLHLLKNGVPFRTFDIALGLTPEGHKEMEGDQKTPEGVYLLDSRNPNSDYFLSIHISYPNNRDPVRARRSAQGWRAHHNCPCGDRSPPAA